MWTFNPPPATIVRFFFTSFELDGVPFCDPNRAPEKGDQIRINGELKRGSRGEGKIEKNRSNRLKLAKQTPWKQNKIMVF